MTGTVSPSRTPAEAVGHSVEKQLGATLWQLFDGTLGLHELTPSLAAWWSLAYEEGRCSRQPEIDRLNAENESLWLRANNDPATASELVQRRLDGSFEEAARRFFAIDGASPGHQGGRA
jgi:hypothetical protein